LKVVPEFRKKASQFPCLAISAKEAIFNSKLARSQQEEGA